MQSASKTHTVGVYRKKNMSTATHNRNTKHRQKDHLDRDAEMNHAIDMKRR